MPVLLFNRERETCDALRRTDNLGSFELPRRSSHGIDCVGTSNTNREHSEATGVWRMRIYGQMR